MIVIVIVIVVCARATSTRAYTYLTRVSKETNTLDKDIDLYKEYMFVYPLYIEVYITAVYTFPALDAKYGFLNEHIIALICPICSFLR